MTIRLTKDMEQVVHDAVRAGLYAREDQVIPGLLARLRESLAKADAAPEGSTKPALTRAEFDQKLLAMGLLERLPEAAEDLDDSEEEPVVIRGEPLSETVIRERR